MKCRTDKRKADVREADYNGLDGVEANDDGTVLTVTFLGRAPRRVGPENIRIDGGRRIVGIRAVDVEIHTAEDPELDDEMRVTVNRPGDNSTYTMRIVEEDAYGRPGTTPYHGFDPRYASADFSFRQACPTDFDCAETKSETSPNHPSPVIDYTARDYASLRRSLLERMTLTLPDWVERHAPDLGVTLVEALAYVGDQLSYQQDAVATEAYLDTARHRVSVRRHVRLVDYAMHDGCNARAWVAMRTDKPLTLNTGDYRFAAIDAGALEPRDRPELGVVISDEQLVSLPPTVTVRVFEPLVPGPIDLHPAHNRIEFWTWGEQECCLPKGATSATLRDCWEDDHDEAEAETEEGRTRRRTLRLAPGDVLVIEEVIGPRTGSPADADPTHRQAVRLTSVTPGVDELYDQPIVEVTWARQDALDFPVCVSTRGGPECELLTDVSVATGNVVLVDHGWDNTYCGGEPELITVPPAETRLPSCDPPAFGCPDRPDEAPVVAKAHDLLTRARNGEPLTEDDIIGLVALLDQATIDRAGLAPDTPAAEQAAALETLLAQITYPAIPPRFRPVLGEQPVTQSVAFPEPGRIANAQAELLAQIPVRVRAWLDRLWRRVRDGHRLVRPEILALRVLFTERVLDEIDLIEHQEQGLLELTARFDRLLSGKLRRIDTLLARARAGAVLGSDAVWEIGQSWGEQYADGLAADDRRLFGPARQAVVQDPRAALPAVTIDVTDVGTWSPRRDLLGSGRNDRHFVGEVDDDGRLVLRFGDGRHGIAPPPGSQLRVRYRVGNGLAGNVGAEAISHLVLCCGVGDGEGITTVRNPMPATGGTAEEPMDQVRQLAPLSLQRTRLRAVTAADYAELAGRVYGVSRAAAQLRWTGTGEQVHVAIDAAGHATADAGLIAAVAGALEQYRRIGHQVTVQPAVLVPVDLEVIICVDPGYQRGHVARAVTKVLNGFFHPDALTFGDPLRVSAIIAAASAVPGVTTAHVTRLKRLFRPAGNELADGLLAVGPLEIIQLDNDSDRPENGRLSIRLGGGR
ncbi:putative baseplate assembly protein [Kibdelosporangium aridum]|uniref:putative baseplate assembly protein n=1 Tax=Kibdelosporangium aridum TaxID=2030 RepID=UPI0005278E91